MNLCTNCPICNICPKATVSEYFSETSQKTNIGFLLRRLSLVLSAQKCYRVPSKTIECLVINFFFDILIFHLGDFWFLLNTNHWCLSPVFTNYWSYVPCVHQSLVTCSLVMPIIGRLCRASNNNWSIVPCVHNTLVNCPLCPPSIGQLSLVSTTHRSIVTCLQ